MKSYNLTRSIFASCIATLALTGTASAAPVMEATQLPISTQMRDRLVNEGRTEAEIEEFARVISSLKVFPDHKNPEATGRNDVSISKIYYAAPFFQASPDRAFVGSEVYADDALKILDKVDEVLDAVSLTMVEYQALIEVRKTIQKNLKKALRDQVDAVGDELANLNAKIAMLNKAKAKNDTELKALRDRVKAGAGELDVELRRELAIAVRTQLSKLGIVPNKREKKGLGPNGTLDELVNAMGTLRARASRGQFGVRQVIFESGLTERQKQALQIYRRLRPNDVQIRGLKSKSTFARPLGQGYYDGDGNLQQLDSMVLTRGVNIGSKGKCGSNRTCNVVLEFSALGARATRFKRQQSMTVTPVYMPVYFEADVEVSEPDFAGSVDCDFSTGWSAKGRADIMDGAVIYDGDLRNSIKYKSKSKGGCDFKILKGSRDSAYFHTLNELKTQYLNLFFDRQKAAVAQKEAYRTRMEQSLQDHQNRARARNRGGWLSDALGFFGGVWGRIGRFFVGESGGFYWHTTILDTENIDELKFTQSFDISNVTATQRFSYDGNSLICYTPSKVGGSAEITACPDGVEQDGDNEVAIGLETCDEDEDFGDCAEDEEDIEEEDQDAEQDEEGNEDECDNLDPFGGCVD